MVIGSLENDSLFIRVRVNTYLQDNELHLVFALVLLLFLHQGLGTIVLG